ncbi:MAG: hypothetical protein E7408_04635 [Ruminococcaceae bacterium]|nr:hypothetical protein [Oscillospiraceae bacterium]
MKTMRKISVTLLVLCIVFGTFPAAASEAPLITNGGFENGTDGWTLVNYFGGEPEDLLVTLNPAEGQYSMVMMPGPTLRRDVRVDGAGVYRLTFQMKSQTAGSLRLIPYYFTTEGYELKPENLPDDIEASYAGTLNTVARGAFGTGEAGWYDVSFDVPVQSDRVATLRLDFSNTNPEEAAMIVDDFALVKVSDKHNYAINGAYENRGMNGFYWSNLARETEENESTLLAALITEEGGNQYMEWKGTDRGWTHQTVWLPSGRYRFSFDIKGAGDGDLVAFAIDPSTDAVDALWVQYGGISEWLEWYRVSDEWQNRQTYFSVPKAADGSDMIVQATFYLPMGTRPTEMLPAFFVDNVVIEEAEDSFVSFSAAQFGLVSKKVYLTTDDTTKPVTKLSDVGAGGTLPVLGLYTPKSVGVAENAMMAVALYKKVEENKLALADFKIVKKAVDITSDGISGASAQGLVYFNDSITLPADLDASYIAKAYIWRSAGLETVAVTEIGY